MIYLTLSGLIILALIIFNITFGLPFFTGAPFAATRPSRAESMIRMLKEALDRPTAGLKAVDLGAGDGRLVIALARVGFEAHGIEINPFLVWFARWKIRRAGLSGIAFVHRGSFWQTNLSSYDVVTLFGITHIMKRLEEKLKAELEPGALVATNYFTFPGWRPLKQGPGATLYRR